MQSEHASSVTDSAERLTATVTPGPPPCKPSASSAITLPEHHPVDLADQPVALGRGQEAPGRDELPLGLVGEAQQRLVVGDASVAQRDDRLVVEDEQVLPQGTAQAREPRAAVQARRARRTRPAGAATEIRARGGRPRRPAPAARGDVWRSCSSSCGICPTVFDGSAVAPARAAVPAGARATPVIGRRLSAGELAPRRGGARGRR